MATDNPSLQQLLEDLIIANRIIYQQNVVDAFGHISVRHANDADKFIMSASMAPGLISSEADLVEYNVSDASPARATTLKHFIERFIHSEIYKRYPEVQCVIHSHSEHVLPYAVSDVRLKPVFHMPAFLGQQAPVFDIMPFYQAGDVQDFLVNKVSHGANLALCFCADGAESGGPDARPDHNIVIMRRHGFTAIGTSIKEAVFRAIYTVKNAKIQTTSTMLRFATGASDRGVQGDGTIPDLSPEQIAGIAATTSKVYDRPWELWTAEASTQGVAKN